MTVDELTPQEIAAALAARRELGPEYEHEIAAALADKMQRRIDSELLARTGAADPSDTPRRREESEVADAVTARWTALGSLAAGTAVTIGCSGPGSTPVVVPIAWAGIMVINIAVNVGRRRRRNR
ncbi:hypothetical protein [Catenulispora rubra]|uniref:hypothetical protein n=1 Tax=Catenulispora rubra TaxID=280293 RepID=UPI00189241F5|nr:hypothetical protein [Catenulispora rubra]